MRTALIVDPALKSRAGHHYNVTKAIIAALADQGLRGKVLVSAWASKGIKRELSAAGCFHHSMYHRRDWTQAGFRRQCFAFSEILRHHLAKWKTLPSVVIFPCCDQVQLNGFAKLVAELGLSWKPTLIAWFIFPPRINTAIDDPCATRQHEECKTAFRNIKAVLDEENSLHLACETNALVEVYQTLSGLPVALLQSPTVLEWQIPQAAVPKKYDQLHLVVTGHANLGKGYDLLPEALHKTIEVFPNIRATIHGTVFGTGNSGSRKIFQSIREIGRQVDVLTGPLDIDHYYRLLSSADFVLLPYDPAVYKDRGSGVFAEATVLGIPTIAPVGCAFAVEAIVQRRAIAITDHNPEALVNAITLAVKQSDQLTANARSNALRLSENKGTKAFILKALRSGEFEDHAGVQESYTQKFWRAIKFIGATVVSLAP